MSKANGRAGMISQYTIVLISQIGFKLVTKPLEKECYLRIFFLSVRMVNLQVEIMLTLRPSRSKNQYLHQYHHHNVCISLCISKSMTFPFDFLGRFVRRSENFGLGLIRCRKRLIASEPLLVCKVSLLSTANFLPNNR